MKQCQSFSPGQKYYSKNIDKYAHQGYTKANNTFDIETKPEKRYVFRIIIKNVWKESSRFSKDLVIDI